jgi:hemerythrin
MAHKYFVSWQAEYSVGIEEIDRQHRRLVGMIGELQQAMWEGRGRAFQLDLVTRLVAYTEEHFRFEENLLQLNNYPLAEEHRAQHRLMAGQAVDLQEKILRGAAVSNASLLLFLRNWLTDHILHHDREYARAFQQDR